MGGKDVICAIRGYGVQEEKAERGIAAAQEAEIYWSLLPKKSVNEGEEEKDAVHGTEMKLCMEKGRKRTEEENTVTREIDSMRVFLSY